MLDRRLNLVIPVDTDAGTVHVHSMPLHKDVFDRYFLVMSKAFALIFKEGLSVIAGPRVAARLIRAAAEQLGVWEDGEAPDGTVILGVKNGLMQEIWRLSNVLAPTEAGGWAPMPLADAVKRQIIDEDDADEVEGVICFFILISAMHKRRDVGAHLDSLQLWQARPTSLTLTEYLNSLPTSTTEDDITSKGNPSSIPG